MQAVTVERAQLTEIDPKEVAATANDLVGVMKGVLGGRVKAQLLWRQAVWDRVGSIRGGGASALVLWLIWSGLSRYSGTISFEKSPVVTGWLNEESIPLTRPVKDSFILIAWGEILNRESVQVVSGCEKVDQSEARRMDESVL